MHGNLINQVYLKRLLLVQSWSVCYLDPYAYSAEQGITISIAKNEN
jgi:hypothetical protein